MGGLPGAMSAISSVSRTKGEREATAGAVGAEGARWAVIRDMPNSKSADSQGLRADGLAQ